MAVAGQGVQAVGGVGVAVLGDRPVMAVVALMVVHLLVQARW